MLKCFGGSVEWQPAQCNPVLSELQPFGAIARETSLRFPFAFLGSLSASFNICHDTYSTNVSPIVVTSEPPVNSRLQGLWTTLAAPP